MVKHAMQENASSKKCDYSYLMDIIEQLGFAKFKFLLSSNQKV